MIPSKYFNLITPFEHNIDQSVDILWFLRLFPNLSEDGIPSETFPYL